MKSAKQNSPPTHITKGDVFDDLGFSPEETLELKIKADIWHALMRHIEQRGLSQAALVNKLKAHQPDVSNLLKGKISKFSITKLIQFADKLELETRVKVVPLRSQPRTRKSNASTTGATRSKRIPA